MINVKPWKLYKTIKYLSIIISCEFQLNLSTIFKGTCNLFVIFFGRNFKGVEKIYLFLNSENDRKWVYYT